MNKTLFLACALTFVFSYGFSQHAETIRKAATAMIKAEDRKDYETFASYLYPSELKFLGGKASLIQNLKNRDRDPVLKNLGVVTTDKQLGKVSKIYKAGKELHCLIDWTLTVKSSRRTYKNFEHYLAISGDQGKTWKFILTGGKTPSEVWAMVPKFNEELTWVDYTE